MAYQNFIPAVWAEGMIKQFLAICTNIQAVQQWQALTAVWI